MIKLQFKWILFLKFDEITVEIMQYESMLLWLLVCPSMEAEYCEGVACLSAMSVCTSHVSVCLHSHLRNHTSKLHLILSACYLRPYPVFLPLAALWYVMDDSCRVCTGTGISLGDAKSAPCRPVSLIGCNRTCTVWASCEFWRRASWPARVVVDSDRVWYERTCPDASVSARQRVFLMISISQRGQA